MLLSHNEWLLLLDARLPARSGGPPGWASGLRPPFPGEAPGSRRRPPLSWLRLDAVPRCREQALPRAVREWRREPGVSVVEWTYISPVSAELQHTAHAELNMPCLQHKHVHVALLLLKAKLEVYARVIG